jgi:casein kinase II subunit beta
MAPRQKSPANEVQQPPGDEEVASANGEGDEIMEEAEEQEDGYSESLLSSHCSFHLVFVSLGHLSQGLN